MKNTTKMNKNMKPAMVFKADYGWSFIFVDTKNKTWFKDEDVLKTFLKVNGITEADFTIHSSNVYYNMKEHNVESGLIAYCPKDDEDIFCLSRTIDVDKLFHEAFNM